MAPPVNRRTGYSRRAQYRTFATYVAGVLGVLVGGGLLASSVLGHVSFGWLHDVAADVQAPPPIWARRPATASAMRWTWRAASLSRVRKTRA
jgi:rod shape-determining protein MreC